MHCRMAFQKCGPGNLPGLDAFHWQIPRLPRPVALRVTPAVTDPDVGGRWLRRPGVRPAYS